MRFENNLGLLDNQKVEKRTKKSPEMSRRVFLKRALGTAGAVVVAKKSLWAKACDFLIKQEAESPRDEIIKSSNQPKTVHSEIEEVKKDPGLKEASVSGDVTDEEPVVNKEEFPISEVVETQSPVKEEAEPIVEEASPAGELPKSEEGELFEKEVDFKIYTEAYDELSCQDKYFPAKLFPKDLLIAQQFQESKYDKNAESRAGASGVMQNMRISIEDVCGVKEYSFEQVEPSPDKKNKLPKVRKKKSEIEGYLHKLYRKKVLKTRVPRSLSPEQIDEIFATMDIADNSRVMGKLYLMKIWDNHSGYGVGREQFAAGDIEGAQNEIMGAYNAGYKNVKGKSMDSWYQEPREYAENIQKFKKMIEEIRATSEEELKDKDVLNILKRTYFLKNQETRKKIMGEMLAAL